MKGADIKWGSWEGKKWDQGSTRLCKIANTVFVYSESSRSNLNIRIIGIDILLMRRKNKNLKIKEECMEKGILIACLNI